MLSQVADYDMSQALDWLPDGAEKQIRKVSVRATLIALSLLAADTARAIVLRPQRPSPVVSGTYAGTMQEPQPDMPLDELFALLQEPKDAETFLKKHIKGYTPESPSDFCGRFRNDPKTMLSEGKGECNNLAEFWCQLWLATGRKPYMVSMWPTTTRCWDKIGAQFTEKKGWHMVAAFERKNEKTGQREFVIGDNQSAVVWNGSLDEFAAQRGMQILPIGGVRTYVTASPDDDFRAKIWDLCGVNERTACSPDESRSKSIADGSHLIVQKH